VGKKKIKIIEAKKVFTEDDAKLLIEDCKGSIRELKTVIKWFRNRFGRSAFTPNITKIIRQHLNILADLHEANVEEFKDKDGNEMKTVLSKVADLNIFLNEVAHIRGIDEGFREVCLTMDGGQDKIILGGIMRDTRKNETENLDDYKSTGQKRVLVLAKVDGVPETRENVEKIIDSLDLPSLTDDFQLVVDLSLANKILGIQSCSSLHACPYCEGSKINQHNNQPTTGRARWIPGPMRTENSITIDQSDWVQQTNSNRKQLKHFNSCEFRPIKLKKCQGDSEILFTLPPDPLHVVLLGPANDLMESLEKCYPTNLKSFYEKHSLKKNGQGPGGKFHGPSIKYILKEETLLDLEGSLPAEGGSFINYMKSIKQLHSVCIASELNDYKYAIENFKTNFDILYDQHNINMTLKIHVIVDHFQDYFDWTKKTFKFTNGEFMESIHSTVKRAEMQHGLKVTRHLGSPMHIEKSLKSIVWHNSRRVGFLKSESFRLRKKCDSETSMSKLLLSQKNI
jgi:hypothetical protein